MKTFIAIVSLLLAPSAIAADAVYIELQDGATSRVFLVKAEETSFGHVEVDGIPDEAGEFSVVCNEYCGIGHHTMVGKIYVVEPGQGG